MKTNYEEKLVYIKEYLGKSESDLVSEFIGDACDNKKFLGEEGSIRALESEEFVEYVMKYLS